MMDGAAEVVELDPRDIDQRETQYNLDAERGLLGALFVDNGAMDDIAPTGIKPEMFALTAHARIFDAMQRLLGRGRPADPATLKPYFEADDSLDDIGGTKYLAHLFASAINVINAPEYARIIVDFHMKREIRAVLHDMQKRLNETDIDDTAGSLIEEIEERIGNIHDAGGDDGATFVGDIVKRTVQQINERYKAGGGLPGMSTGLERLDDIMDGLVGGDVIILAGRPGMGKTAAATGFARTVGENEGATKGPALTFNIEMSDEQLGYRMLSEETGIPMKRLRRGEVEAEDFTTLAAAEKTMRDRRVINIGMQNPTVQQIHGAARRIKRKHGLSVIVIDYLQLLRAGDRYRGQRTNELEEVTRQIKVMARQLDVPVIVLSQLSRDVEKRENKRPMLSDLRNSGSIEQDADTVMFIYREHYYLEKAKPEKRADEDDSTFFKRELHWKQRCEAIQDRAEIIVGKCRQGATGTAVVRFDAERVRFTDWTARQEETGQGELIE